MPNRLTRLRRPSCGQVFGYAIATGRLERDLFQDLRGAIPLVKKSHVPTLTGPRAMGGLLRAIDGIARHQVLCQWRRVFVVKQVACMSKMAENVAVIMKDTPRGMSTGVADLGNLGQNMAVRRVLVNGGVLQVDPGMGAPGFFN